MWIVSAFTHLVDGFAQTHRRRRNERILDSLPREIRKDVGWRGTDPSESEDARCRPYRLHHL